MYNNILIIAGMHRSGTSLISHWLRDCGLNIGHTLLGGDIGNVEGHFEDVDFFRFHEDTLEEHNLPRFGMVTAAVKQLSYYQREKIKSVIDFKNRMSRQWGWKDPRTCLFFAEYRELVPDAYYLHIVRDYKSTVTSLIMRDFRRYERKYLSRKLVPKLIWLKIRRSKHLKKFFAGHSEFYLRVWLAYNKEILNNIHALDNEKYVVVDNSMMQHHNVDVFRHLTDQWHFKLEYKAFEEIFKSDLVSEPEEVDAYISDLDLLNEAKELEATLKALASTTELNGKKLLATG